MPGVKTAGNVVITFDGLNMTPYLSQASIDSVLAKIDVTTFASTGNDTIPSFGDWNVPVGGPWAKLLDDKFGPGAISPPDADNRKDLSVALTDATGDVVTYSWTAAAYIDRYQMQMQNPKEAIRWTGNLSCANAPDRAVA